MALLVASMELRMLAQLVPTLVMQIVSIRILLLELVNVILDLPNLGLGVIEIQMHAEQPCVAHLALHVDASLVRSLLQSIVRALE